MQNPRIKMADLGLVNNSKKQLELLIAAASNPRDEAFAALLGRSGVRISEAISIEETDVNFINGTLTIVHLKERIKCKCPQCGAILGKRHIFCPGCGNKVDLSVREKVQQRRQRTIPIDNDTLALIKKYLKWRRQFSYCGPLLFPFSRQRGWQLVERLGRRIGVKGLHPHSFRHMLATTWVTKGLDVKKLQLMLGHASIATTMEYVDSNFEQLKAEYDKLWEGNDDDKSSE